MVWVPVLWTIRRPQPEPEPEPIHRGRIFRDAHSGWWRYVCKDCEYGAGSAEGGEQTWRWLMDCANEHADPKHLSRLRGRRRV